MITGYELDLQMRWPAGTSERLAKRARLPHFKLPNGEIRFDLDEIKKLIQHVTPTGAPKENRPWLRTKNRTRQKRHIKAC